jgi:RHS repeat-associated protein
MQRNCGLKRRVLGSTHKAFYVLCALMALAVPALTQTIPQGVTQGSTQITAGPVNIDMATGNMVVDIPVRHKTGAFPFGFDLIDNTGNQGAVNSYDAFAWSMPSAGVTGFNVPNVINCGSPPNVTAQFGTGLPGQWSVSDGTGATHPFLIGPIRVGPSGCGGVVGPVTSVATDGSGYTVVVTGSNSASGTLTWIVYTKDGISYSGGESSTGTWTDPDNNTIQDARGSTNVWTDTLGQTAMSMVYNGPGATGDQYSYTDASGATQYYKVAYTSKHVKTIFGCGSPYGDSDTTGVYLPSSVTTPVGTYFFTYELTGSAYGSDVTGRLLKVTLPTGGNVSFVYSGGTAGFNCTSRVVPTLAVKVDDNNGTTNTTTYVNSNTSNYEAPCCANFNVTVTSNADPDNGGAQNVTINSFNGEWLTQSVAYEGAATGTPLSIVQTCYDGNSTTCATPPAPVGGEFGDLIKQKQTFTVYNSPSLTGAKEVLTTYDCNTISPCYGNVVSVANYDYGQTLLSTTNYVYGGCGAGTYVVDRPCSVTTLDSGSHQVSQTKYTYSPTGHPTQTKKWVSGTNTYLTYSASYNGNGTIASFTDANAAPTTYQYNGTDGCNGLLLTSTTYPLASVGTSYQQWDCNGGVMTLSTDVNGPKTIYSYTANGADPVYRLKQVTHADGGTISYTYNTGTTFPWTIEKTVAVDSGGNSFTTTSSLDGLGRTYSVQTTDPNSNTGYRYVNTSYNTFGEVSAVSNPFFHTGDPTYGITSYTHDALGRVTQRINPDLTSLTKTYKGRAVYVQDESGVQKAFQSDGLGRLQYVCDGINAGTQANSATIASCGLDVAASGFLSTYGYDPLGNITSVKVGAYSGYSGQPRSYTYDGLSRLLTESNPETGSISNVYDTATAGDLASKTTPLSTLTYEFDSMHRLTEILSGGSGLVGYVYDRPTAPTGWPSTNLANTKGRLSWSSTVGTGWDGVYSYDPMGRLNQSWTCTSDTCYASPRYLGYTYNYLGQVQTTAAAGGTFTLSNTYNATGELTSITSSLVDATHPGTLFTGGPYNALGEVEAATYGDGIIRNITYDHRGRPTVIRDSTTYALYLGYTGNSSVASANDSVNGDWSFTYDAFNRLAASSNTSSGAAYTYGYDQVGNRWRQDRTAGIGLTVDLNFDLTTNRVTGGSYAYDAGGNMTSDGSCSNPCWAYDKLGNLISGEGATYAYDAFNQRVQKTKGGTTYDLVMGLNGQPFDEYQGTTHTRTTAGFITYANNTTYFNHADHLGTPRITTDYTGTVQRTQVNLPFGDGFVETPLMPILDFSGFTGGTWDQENNADHFGAREYDKTPGRWFSPDPAGLDAVDPSNPQTWNLYAYVMHNPLSLRDPSGLEALGQQWGGVAGQSGDCSTGLVFPCPSSPPPPPPDPNGYKGPGFAGTANALALASTNAVTAQLKAAGASVARGWLRAVAPIFRATDWVDRHPLATLPLAALAFVGGETGPLEEDAAAAEEVAGVAEQQVTDNVSKATAAIEEWLGPGYKSFSSPTSDLALKSQDGTRMIRFDLTNPHGLDPHVNIETWQPRNLYPGDTRMLRIDNLHLFLQP